MAEELLKDVMYGDLLNSPGYEVEFAVGLTYSLDLDALISVPMSFGLLGESEEIIHKSPAYLLAAIRKSSDKMAVFCNVGNIKVPKENRLVYPLLENCIFPVRQKGNFHPKLWVIQEVSDEGGRRIRIVVLSRNLTFDDSLDIAVSLTGEVTEKVRNRKKYMPVVDLLDWAAKFASPEKRNKVRKVCDSIRCVEKFLVDDPFDDCEFFAFNEKLMGQSDVEDDLQGRDTVVVSPFVDESFLSWLFTKANHKCLITRQNFITSNIFNLVGHGNVFSVNESLLDDEESHIDLHAKMYFVSKDGNNNLYIGSANATQSAFNRNTEFLLKLHFKPYKSSFDKFKEMLLNDEDCIFVPVDTPVADIEKTSTWTQEELIFKEVVKNVGVAKVIKKGLFYDIVISFKKCDWNLPVKIATLQGPANKSNVTVAKETIISNVALKDISQFYVVTVGTNIETQKCSVVKIETENIPNNRDEVIFQSIVDTENKFINYISFLLSEKPQEFIYDADRQEKLLRQASDNHDVPVVTTLYEDMLKSITRHPERMKVIEQDIDKFGDKVPNSFKQLLSVLKESLKYLR